MRYSYSVASQAPLTKGLHSAPLCAPLESQFTLGRVCIVCSGPPSPKDAPLCRTYNFLKENVLRITFSSDYTYLDRLFITETKLESGGLFLLGKALQGTLGTPTLVEWPSAQSISLLELLQAHVPEFHRGKLVERLVRLLSGLISRKPKIHQEPPCEGNWASLKLVDGAEILRHGDALLITVLQVRLPKQKLRLRLTNLGICGSEPKLIEIELSWQGIITKARRCSLTVTKSRGVIWSDLPLRIRKDSYNHNLLSTIRAISARNSDRGTSTRISVARASMRKLSLTRANTSSARRRSWAEMFPQRRLSAQYCKE